MTLEVTPAQYEQLRAKIELETLVMVRDNPSVQRTLDARIARLERQIKKDELP